MARSGAHFGTGHVGSVLFAAALADVRAHRASARGPILPSSAQMSEPFLSRPSPRLPRHNRVRTLGPFGGVSLLFHATVLATMLGLLGAQRTFAPNVQPDESSRMHANIPRLVFLPKPGSGGGGGGGGNRQRAPVPRAQAKGQDAVTLPAAAPIVSIASLHAEVPSLPAVALDAQALASGVTVQVGLPESLSMLGTSQGPGTGGGVGDGVGTGIGSGSGPGLGPGSGGGTGGGVYRPGNGVTWPALLLEVKPIYTPEALRDKIQGSVILEAVVQRDGTARNIRVIRSLDQRGLDRQAILAVEQWRFSPGRRGTEAVDVLVTIILDFSIR